MEEITVKTLDDRTKAVIWDACLRSASNSSKNADDLAIDLIRAYSIIFSKKVLDRNPYYVSQLELYRRMFPRHKVESARLKEP